MLSNIYYYLCNQQPDYNLDFLTNGFLLAITNFYCRFEALQSGTHFYHAHVGLQRGDGIAGALVIKSRRPRHGIHKDLPEHTIVIQDWHHALSVGQAMLHFHARGTNTPDSLLINGTFIINFTIFLELQVCPVYLKC